jgi:hypothetical protein
MVLILYAILYLAIPYLVFQPVWRRTGSLIAPAPGQPLSYIPPLLR